MMRYAIDLIPEDDVLLVECPDLQGVHSFGDDEHDALRHGLDAVLTRLEMYMDDRQPIPHPRARRKHYVEVPPIAEAKIRLYEFMLFHLTEANAHRSLRHLDEVIGVFGTIADAYRWILAPGARAAARS